LCFVGAHLAREQAVGHTRSSALALMQEHRKRGVRARPFRPEDARRFCYRNVLGAL
jgi:hypothetical protein